MSQTNERNRRNDRVFPNPLLSEVNMLGSVPAMIQRYALNEEQRLLAVLRYNRLLDVFTGAVCYSLQSSLRTLMPAIGEVETGDVYLGIGMAGRQFVFPVQAGNADNGVGIVEAERDLAVCTSQFPPLTCRPIAAQFMDAGLIALFEFGMSQGELSIKEEKHYRLVTDEDVMDGEFTGYRLSRNQT